MRACSSWSRCFWPDVLSRTIKISGRLLWLYSIGEFAASREASSQNGINIILGFHVFSPFFEFSFL
uniref:Uncharacterized protein n=1 Tax=Arundo donax TaxID=35708 RepID=A0A0A9F4B6_ARUDO